MASEASLRRIVVQTLTEVSAFSVENPIWPGTPDVSTTLGWIELKVLRDWPKRIDVVRVPHFTPQQRLWHRRWTACGGVSYVLIKIGKGDILLLDGALAAHHLGNCTKQETLDLALGYWGSVGKMREGLLPMLYQAWYKRLPATGE